MGIIIRIGLAAVSFHPHFWDLNFTSYLFAYKGVFNVYDYLANLPSDNPWVGFYSRGVFTYPPLAYFTLGFFTFLLKPLINPSFMDWFVNHPIELSMGNYELFRHLLIVKMPYLVFDLLVLFILTKMFSDLKDKKKILLLWLLNPLSLYTSFMVSQFDIIPVFFVVLAFYCALNKKNVLSLILLSIGGSFKMFPLLLVPLFALVLETTLSKRLKLLFFGIAPYFITLLPFMGSSAFRQTVLFSNQSQKMLFMGLPVSGAETIYIFILGLVIVWWLAFYNYILKERLWIYILITFLLYFSITHYHPQWFLWITPFLLYELVVDKFNNYFCVLVLFLCWLFLTLLFEASLSYGVFCPLSPFLLKAPSLSLYLTKYIDPFLVKSAIRTIFAGTSIFLVFLIFKNKSEATKN